MPGDDPVMANLATRIEREFWMESSSQAVWAVELHDGVVAGCWGPLLPEEVDEDLLDAFEYGRGGAAWIEQNRERFCAIRSALLELPEM